ncbi:MAG: DNA replication/repair protein RecF [Polyangia bacterium]
MILRELRTRGWRNLAALAFRPGPGATVLFGQNGQGKTNILEAAYTALCFRSFRTSSLSDVVGWGTQGATIEAEITARTLDRTLKIQISQGRKNTFLDGKAVRRDSSALLGVGAVLFGPEDLRLPKAAAAERRRFLDRAVFGAYRPYFREVLTFERVLKSRNALLRGGSVEATLLASYDEKLAEAGARIVIRRREMVRSLLPRLEATFLQIHGEAAVGMRYTSERTVQVADSEEDIVSALREGLLAHRETDQRRGFTGFGPQTDDLELDLAGHLAREHASQGQLRSLVLALKLAEVEHLREALGEAPLLLLDDVASELDEERRRSLFAAMAALSCQSLITVTERDHLPPLPACVDYMVSGGELRRM